LKIYHLATLLQIVTLVEGAEDPMPGGSPCRGKKSELRGDFDKQVLDQVKEKQSRMDPCDAILGSIS
jgi:hypothetical protein